MQNRVSYDLISKSLKTKICRTIIFPVVLYECYTWSLTLKEELKLRVFEDMKWRKLHNEELNDLQGTTWKIQA